MQNSNIQTLCWSDDGDNRSFLLGEIIRELLSFFSLKHNDVDRGWEAGPELHYYQTEVTSGQYFPTCTAGLDQTKRWTMSLIFLVLGSFLYRIILVDILYERTTFWAYSLLYPSTQRTVVNLKPELYNSEIWFLAYTRVREQWHISKKLRYIGNFSSANLDLGKWKVLKSFTVLT